MQLQRLWWFCALLTPALMAGPGNTSSSGAWKASSRMAQPTHESSNLWFSARLAGSDRLENAFSYRFYGEPRQLVIILNIGHEGLQSAVADQEDFTRQLRVSMKDEENRPVALKTDGAFWRFTDAGRVQLRAGEPLHVVSGRGIEWELRLQRADGQRFATGRQTIELSLAGPFRALRLADGSTPPSRQLSDAVLEIRLGLPTNARERGSMYELAAQEAIQEQRYADAAATAQRAIDTDPSNSGAYTVLGDAFLHLNRCPEAAAALEKVLQVGLVGHTAIPELLVQAYVCVGDEQNAKRVLRLRGVPAAQLDAEIAQRARLQLVGGTRR